MSIPLENKTNGQTHVKISVKYGTGCQNFQSSCDFFFSNRMDMGTEVNVIGTLVMKNV